MTRGLKDVQGCPCPEWDVWGISLKAPYKGTVLDSSGPNANSQPYKGGYDPGPVLPYTQGEPRWFAEAVKVPSSYRPYVNLHAGVEKSDYPISSTAAAGEFAVSLPEEITRLNDLDPDTYEKASHVFGSRTIYRDGVQKFVAYWQEWAPDSDFFGNTLRFGVVSVIDIANKSGVLSFDLDFNEDLGPYTEMENRWLGGVAKGPFVTGGQGNTWKTSYSYAPPRTFCIGRRYFISSSYYPGAAIWGVGKVDMETGLVFCSDGEVGNLNLDYSIALPAIRSDGDDELWVCALSKSATPKVVVGRWTNQLLRAGSGDMTTGFADGSLTEAEVHRVVLQGAQYSGVEIICYNRVRGRNLLILNTEGGRYYYDGSQLRSLSGGGSFISMDHEDNILIADQHHLKKISPLNEIIWQRSFSAPDTDNIPIPPEEAVQILPTKKWIQLRGMNGWFQDASVHPRPQDGENWGYENKDYQCVQNWPFNLTNWSVSHDGQIRVPHLEVVFEAPEFHFTLAEALAADPPFPLDWTASQADWDEHTKHVGINKLKPRTYSDILAHLPQVVWMRELYDDAGTTRQRWHLMKNFEAGVPGSWIYRTTNVEGECLDENFDGETDPIVRRLGTDTIAMSDWDAVDSDEECCGCDPAATNTGW